MLFIGKRALNLGVDRVMRDDVITILRLRVRALCACLLIPALILSISGYAVQRKLVCSIGHHIYRY